ncbi:hypothetical protein C7212DRAFT_303836 [Tuber magnatum]|uniref:Uncharacterized protein n=1 Tax=Tuber magnatum TaxID=42249 RepID=A0A317SXC3_9PEZI|nr:hypothetical protein C7212DRAFT_303836 [Tuber magnatum]
MPALEKPKCARRQKPPEAKARSQKRSEQRTIVPACRAASRNFQHCAELQETPGDSGELQENPGDCGGLWGTAEDHQGLWETVGDCGRPPRTMGDCGGLWEDYGVPNLIP